MRIAIRFTSGVPLALFGFALLCSSGAAWAKEPPSDLCSLLTPAQLEKTIGRPFTMAEKKAAPPAFRNQPEGMNCGFSSTGKAAGIHVTLIAYVDASLAQAKDTFDKLAMYFKPKSKPPIGDSAYIDGEGAIHVLKGKVRFYIEVEPARPMEKQQNDLAILVADEI
jgi:hypothetical protein